MESLYLTCIHGQPNSQILPECGRVRLHGEGRADTLVSSDSFWTHLVNLKSKWKKDFNHLPNAVLFPDFFLSITSWQFCGIRAPLQTEQRMEKVLEKLSCLWGLDSLWLEVWGEFTVVIYKSWINCNLLTFGLIAAIVISQLTSKGSVQDAALTSVNSMSSAWGRANVGSWSCGPTTCATLCSVLLSPDEKVKQVQDKRGDWRHSFQFRLNDRH